jgi:hypothetical protein
MRNVMYRCCHIHFTSHPFASLHFTAIFFNDFHPNFTWPYLSLFSQCIRQGSLSVIEYFIYLLYHRNCFWAFVPWWHGIQISAMLAAVSTISGIPVLGRPPSWCGHSSLPHCSFCSLTVSSCNNSTSPILRPVTAVHTVSVGYSLH